MDVRDAATTVEYSSHLFTGMNISIAYMTFQENVPLLLTLEIVLIALLSDCMPLRT